MERDENNQRVAFTPSEAVAMAAMIEGPARAEAKVRQVEAGKNNGRGQIASGQMAGSYKQAEFTRESRQQIAEAVGMATTTLRRAQDVVKHGTPELVKAMDSGEVSGLFCDGIQGGIQPNHANVNGAGYISEGVASLCWG